MMNKAEKIVTMMMAIVGGVAGPWGAYTAYDASKFTQPFDEREQMVKSFKTQIASAEKREDVGEINRVSLLLEKYEESWRSARKLTKLVEPIEGLVTTNLGDSESQSISQLLHSLSDSQSSVSISPKTLGAAYFVTGDYQKAIHQLNLVSESSDNRSVNAIKAAAYAGMANLTEDQAVASAYRNSAFYSFISARAGASDNEEVLSGFAASSAELKRLLEEKGVVLTSPSSRR